MKDVIKYYNFCNFNLKVASPCLSKNDLSVCKFSNVDVYSNSISSINGFENIFINLFSENIFLNLEKFKEFVLVCPYDYFDSEKQDYSTIYFCIDKDLALYRLTYNGKVLSLLNLKTYFNQLPKVFLHSGKIYFYENSENFFYFENDQDAIIVSDFADIQSYYNFYENSFFIVKNEPYKILYTEKTDIENLSNDYFGYSEIQADSINGKVLKIVSLKNSLYVVSQYAISKLVQEGDEFYLSTNCFIKSKINENTIFEINDYIMFFAEGRAYLFDGNEFEEIFEKETDLIDTKSIIKGEVFDNKYYLLCRLKGKNQNAIVEFDIGKNKAKIYEMDGIVDMYKIKTILCYKLAVLVKQKNVTTDESDDDYMTYELTGAGDTGGEKFVKFNTLCFDEMASKIVSDIKIICSGDFVLKISSENSSVEIPVSGNLDIRSLGISGYAFDIEIASTGEFDIKSILFKVQTLTE